MAKLADARDLKSCGEILEGSIPFPDTMLKTKQPTRYILGVIGTDNDVLTAVRKLHSLGANKFKHELQLGKMNWISFEGRLFNIGYHMKKVGIKLHYKKMPKDAEQKADVRDSNVDSTATENVGESANQEGVESSSSNLNDRQNTSREIVQDDETSESIETLSARQAGDQEC